MNQPVLLPENLKSMAYLGMVFWIAAFCCYFAGLYLSRVGTISQPENLIKFYGKMIIIGNTLVKIILFLIIMRSLYGIYIFFQGDYRMIVEGNSILIFLLIPAYFVGLASLKLLEILVRKGH